jgi:hypothetical protein
MLQMYSNHTVLLLLPQLLVGRCSTRSRGDEKCIQYFNFVVISNAVTCYCYHYYHNYWLGHVAHSGR